ncbi:hypothetical protein Tco_0068135 [Tanacetum coccineum]
MSSNNASYAVTYTSISSDSNGLSWGIPLVNAGELLEMDPYKELEHPEYHAPSNDDVQEDSIDYPDKPEDDYEDTEEDPKEDHTDYPADGEDRDEPSDDDDDDDDTGDKDEEPTKDEEEEHIRLTLLQYLLLTLFSQLGIQRHMRLKTVKLEPPMSASIKARIAEHAAAPIPPTIPTYDQEPLGHRAAMICMRDDIPEEDMLP